MQLADILLSGIFTPVMTSVKIARGKKSNQVPVDINTFTLRCNRFSQNLR